MDLKNSLTSFDIFHPLTYYIPIIYFITRVLENFTNTSNFWTKVWNKIVDINDDDYTFKLYGTIIYTSLIYWIVGLLYFSMDVTQKPKSFRKYKTQPDANEPLDYKKILLALPLVLFNQLILNPIVTCIFVTIGRKTLSSAHIRYTTSFQQLMIDIIVYQLIYEACFYYAHRLFHHKYFYAKIHKVHHKFTAPVSLMATYAHPIEHIFANMLPIVIPISLLKLPISTSWIVMTLTTIATLGDHSGYHLPFLHSPQFHDWHHAKFSECYGAMGILDKFHGTSKNFEKAINSIRHRTIFSMKSVVELYPDDLIEKSNIEAKNSENKKIQ
ncbi:hypothetical protein PVAND_012949 [Polypedilum vanderplanki]|uniref:Fatty acid hydroxylase domain-containing protein n=1 Tax=Polypedilum vanderplanki TaxID=319348 RepID=A0A9J6CPZ5_POLVA|nr:hypothetical protein PVAND_012949 [Polypedilum vanderplanki]